MTEVTIHRMADRLYRQFKYEDRNGEQIAVLRDRNSEDGQLAAELVYELHDGALVPSDMLYEEVYSLLGEIRDQGAEEVSDLYLEGDVYTSDLDAWMDENNGWRVDKQIREYGLPDEGLDGAIRAAQVEWKYELAHEIFNHLREMVGEINDGLEEE